MAPHYGAMLNQWRLNAILLREADDQVACQKLMSSLAATRDRVIRSVNQTDKNSAVAIDSVDAKHV